MKYEIKEVEMTNWHEVTKQTRLIVQVTPTLKLFVERTVTGL